MRKSDSTDNLDIVARLNRNFYDEFAMSDEAVEEEFRTELPRRIKVIKGLLTQVEPRRCVADVGCGTGIMTREYRIPGVEEIEGFDISENSLEKARSKGITTHFWNANAGRAPGADSAYDVIIAAEVVEHVIDVDSFLAELSRMCRPRGYLIVSTPNLNYWKSRIAFLFGHFPYYHPSVSSSREIDPRVDARHIRIGNVSEWSSVFAGHDLEIKAIIGMPRPRYTPSLTERLLSWLDSVFSHRPTLAAQLAFLLQKKP